MTIPSVSVTWWLTKKTVFVKEENYHQEVWWFLVLFVYWFLAWVGLCFPLFCFLHILFLEKTWGGEAETERKHGIYLCKHDLLCFSNAIWHGGGQWSLPLMHQPDSGAEKVASIMVSARYFNNVWKLARKLQHSLEKKRGAGQNKWIKWRNNEENKHGTCFKDRGN